MAYYDALASSAPSKKKPNKNRPNRLRFVVGGKKFVLFSSFAGCRVCCFVPREGAGSAWHKKCVCGNPGEVQPRHGVGGNVKNSLLAFVRESRALEQVGLHGREGEIIELRILLFSTLGICRFLFLFLKKCIFYQIVCAACLCSRTPENQQAVPTACQTATTRAAACQDFFTTSICRKKKKFLNRRFFCVCFSMLCFCSLLLSLYHFLVCFVFLANS